MDDPMFNSILEAASSLDVPLYLHPSIPSKVIQDEYYGGLDPLVSARFATGGWGWHNEAGIQVLRMILAGVFDKYPNLQIILGHWGEMVPFYLSRTDSVLTPVAKNLKRSVSDYFLNNVYVTPSGMFDQSQLMHTHQVMGADRIMYSVDYPFSDNKGARAFLENAAISHADKEKIAHGNAERLLKL
jgi:predicted TIM-barrel fold metal-dependent hydrolase